MGLEQLQGCELKLGRARFHLNALVTGYAEWVRDNLTLEYAPEIAPWAEAPWRLHVAADVPHEYGLPFGDCLQCARAALDYLVYELAILNGTPEPKMTQFPISTDVSRYRKTGRDQDHLLDPRHRRVIRLLQPYQAKHPESHPLAVLNRLSNADKHRLLHVVHSGMTHFRASSRGGSQGVVLSLYGEEERFEAASADPNVGAILMVDCNLKEGNELFRVPLLLQQIIDFAGTVIDWFRPVFAEKP